MNEITHNGNVVSTSRNLRGILDYARKHPARLFSIEKCLYVTFDNKALSRVEFADKTVLTAWIADRIKYGRGKFHN